MICSICNAKQQLPFGNHCPNCLFLSSEEEQEIIKSLIDKLFQEEPEAINFDLSLQISLIMVVLPYVDTFKIRFQKTLEYFIEQALKESIEECNIDA